MFYTANNGAETLGQDNSVWPNLAPQAFDFSSPMFLIFSNAAAVGTFQYKREELVYP
jgi:hypothetical protein